MKAAMIAAMLTLGLLAAPCEARAQVSATDRVLLGRIAEQVNRYTQYTIFDSISTAADDGHVVLRGWVTMPYKREDIEARVRRVDGVSTVENGIEVLPASTADDALRFRIARAIYGNSSFWQYAALVNPPIHIVVRGKRVRLEGVVNTNVERMLARSLAAGFGALDVTNALLTADEVRETLGTGGASR